MALVDGHRARLHLAEVLDGLLPPEVGYSEEGCDGHDQEEGENQKAHALSIGGGFVPTAISVPFFDAAAAPRLPIGVEDVEDKGGEGAEEAAHHGFDGDEVPQNHQDCGDSVLPEEMELPRFGGGSCGGFLCLEKHLHLDAVFQYRLGNILLVDFRTVPDIFDFYPTLGRSSPVLVGKIVGSHVLPSLIRLDLAAETISAAADITNALDVASISTFPVTVTEVVVADNGTADAVLA